MAEEVEDAKERESHGSTSTGTGDLAGELSKSKETIQQLAAQLLRAQTAKHDAEMNAAGLEEEVRRLRDANERIGEIAKRLEARSANVSEAIRAQNVAEAETARLKKELAILKAKNDESAALIELFESRRVEAERTASDRRARVLASFVRHLKEAAEYVHEGKRPRRPFREWCAEVESEVEQHLSGAGVSWLQEVFLATRNAARRFAAQSNETDDEEYLRYQYVLNNLKSDLEQTGEACFRV
jgi:chromosome segregation ATPase